MIIRIIPTTCYEPVIPFGQHK
uniref:Uncharacterized protein n=1 Tax=Tetranychus urticae TaxID=32264 RepID=T1KUZ0_TETUR